jgi:hypothetical protein
MSTTLQIGRFPSVNAVTLVLDLQQRVLPRITHQNLR